MAQVLGNRELANAFNYVRAAIGVVSKAANKFLEAISILTTAPSRDDLRTWHRPTYNTASMEINPRKSSRAAPVQTTIQLHRPTHKLSFADLAV